MKQALKKWIYFLLLTSLINLDAMEYDDEASKLYQATLYSKVIPLYENQLEKMGFLEKNSQLELIYSYYQTDNYSKLVNFTKRFPPTDPEMIYLSAKSHRHLKQFNEALLEIEQYTKQFPNKGELETGIIYFDWNKLEESKKHLMQSNSNLAKLYRVRIAILEDQFNQADQLLKDLATTLNDENPLLYAISFLHGEIFYRKGDYAKACVYFEQALPQKNEVHGLWYPDTLYQLGWSYLMVADLPNQLKKVQKKYFTKADESFAKLSKLEDSDRVHLAVAQAQIMRGKKLIDYKALKKAGHTLSDEESTHANLLMAETYSNYEKRAQLYEKITDRSNKESPFYAKSWFLRGLNEFNQGKGHFKTAASHFETAFSLLYSNNKYDAALALKYQAYSLASFENKEGSLKALSLLNEYLNQFSEELLPLLDEPGEIYYLHGQVASRLYEEDGEEAFFEVAQKSLLDGSDKYPRGKYNIETLKTLGMLYYSSKDSVKAESVFQKIADEFPHSDQAGEALFWAAIATDSIAKEKALFTKVYEKYPLSTYADEAYFRIYTYEEYLNGKPKPIEHLEKFGTSFPDTPYRMLADYLLALHFFKSDSVKGRDHLKRVELTFEQFTQTEKIPNDKVEYFTTIYYRAQLERGESLFKEGKFQQAKEILSQVFNEHKLQSNTIMQESGYWLTKTLLSINELDAAQHVIDFMLDKFKSQKMTRGYFLSRIWYEKGRLAMRLDNPDNALHSFIQAEETGKGRVLATDELLDLWIQQSLSYRDLKKLDQAMLILSRVINYDAISSLRLNAMYLRAKIYELQGRQELARKQLDAIASKGGNWALKAKRKLEKDYEYQ